MNKVNILFLMVLVLFLQTSCSEDESDSYLAKLRIFRYDQAFDSLVSNGLLNEETIHLEPMSGVKVSFYKTETDYLTDQNPVFVQETDSEGFIQYEQRSAGVDYFIRAESGDYSSYRWGTNISQANQVSCNNCNQSYDYWALTLIPSRLQLQVINSSGEPVAGATVSIYPSENDYLANNQNWIHDAYEMGAHGSNREIKYTRQTNTDGVITFTNLAPRIFWFRITSSEGNNDNGYNHLNEPLPADPEVAYVTNVAVN